MSEWFCKIAGREIGPLAVKQLKRMAQQGQLRPDDLIRQGTAGKWVPASRVKGLFPLPGEAVGAAAEAIPVALPVTDDSPAATSKPVIVEPMPVSATPVGEPLLPRAVPAATPPEAVSTPASASTAAPFDFGPPPSRTGRKSGGRKSAVVTDPAVLRRKRKRQTIVVVASAVATLLALGAVVAYLASGSKEAPHSVADRIADKSESGASPVEEEVVDLDEIAGKPKSAFGNLADTLQTTGESSEGEAGATAPGGDAATAEWLEPTEPATLGKFQVRIDSIGIGPARYRSKLPSTDANRPMLLVKVAVSSGEQEKKAEYKPWNHRGGFASRVTLTDDKGNPYRQLPKEPREALADQLLAAESIYPGDSIFDLLAFEPPVKTAQELRLQLPGEALGKKEVVRFKIPRAVFSQPFAVSATTPQMPASEEPSEPPLTEEQGGPSEIQRGIAEMGGETEEATAAADGTAPTEGADAPLPDDSGQKKKPPEEDIREIVAEDTEEIGGGEMGESAEEHDFETILGAEEPAKKKPGERARPSSRRDRRSDQEEQ